MFTSHSYLTEFKLHFYLLAKAWAKVSEHSVHATWKNNEPRSCYHKREKLLQQRRILPWLLPSRPDERWRTTNGGRRASKRHIYMPTPKKYVEVQPELRVGAERVIGGPGCSHHVNIFPRAGRPRFHSAWYLRHSVHRYFCLKEKRKSLPLSAINHELIINQHWFTLLSVTPTLTITFWVFSVFSLSIFFNIFSS